MRLEPRFSDDPRGVFLGALKTVDDRPLPLLTFFALFFFQSPELLRAQLALLSLSLLLLLQVAAILLLALLIQLDESSVFSPVFSDLSLGLWHVYVVYEVEGYKNGYERL